MHLGEARKGFDCRLMMVVASAVSNKLAALAVLLLEATFPAQDCSRICTSVHAVVVAVVCTAQARPCVCPLKVKWTEPLCMSRVYPGCSGQTVLGLICREGTSVGTDI